MNHLFDPRHLTALANTDGEFRLQARYWDAQLCLQDTDQGAPLNLTVREQQLTVDPTAASVADVTIKAPTAQWLKLLAQTPAPFHHDLWAARVHHGFRYEGDMQHIAAYYPAIRRLVELMREAHHAAV